MPPDKATQAKTKAKRTRAVRRDAGMVADSGNKLLDRASQDVDYLRTRFHVAQHHRARAEIRAITYKPDQGNLARQRKYKYYSPIIDYVANQRKQQGESRAHFGADRAEHGVKREVTQPGAAGGGWARTANNTRGVFRTAGNNCQCRPLPAQSHYPGPRSQGSRFASNRPLPHRRRAGSADYRQAEPCRLGGWSSAWNVHQQNAHAGEFIGRFRSTKFSHHESRKLRRWAHVPGTGLLLKNARFPAALLE